MTATPTPALVLLGGGFSHDSDPLLDDFVLAASGRPRPRICFLPTASGDAPGYVERFGGGALPGGWAVDDGTAALFAGGRPVEVVTRKPGATLHRVTAGADGAAREAAQAARVLGAQGGAGA
ncbi:hypothetical protein [Streptomyces kronopolitis]